MCAYVNCLFSACRKSHKHVSLRHTMLQNYTQTYLNNIWKYNCLHTHKENLVRVASKSYASSWLYPCGTQRLCLCSHKLVIVLKSVGF